MTKEKKEIIPDIDKILSEVEILDKELLGFLKDNNPKDFDTFFDENKLIKDNE